MEVPLSLYGGLFLGALKMGLPRGWRYLDAGMMLGTALVVVGVIIEISALTHPNEKPMAVIGVILAILGIVATIWMGYLGTRSIKSQLHKWT